MWWNYLSIPKLQRCNRWSLGMDKQFHPTLYQAGYYLSMLGLKLNHVSKKGHMYSNHCSVHWTHFIQHKRSWVTFNAHWLVGTNHNDDVAIDMTALLSDDITVTSWCARWRFKSVATRLFAQPCVQAHISTKTSKFRVTGPWEGNPSVTGEFHSQKVSNAENVSIWWRHHINMKMIPK